MKRTVIAIAAVLIGASGCTAQQRQIVNNVIDEPAGVEVVEPAGGVLPVSDPLILAEPLPCWPGAGYEQGAGQLPCEPAPPVLPPVDPCVGLAPGSAGCLP